MSESGLIIPNGTEAEARAEIERLDGLAAEMFPEQWARANRKSTRRSKARRSLRERVKHELKMQDLKASGACCGNCRDFKPRPGPGRAGEMICDAGSDFHGDMITTADQLCIGHVWRQSP